MFNFISKGNYLADLLSDFHDIHSHLLPGVDDGSPDREHTHTLLREMENMGIKGLYMTPHLISGAYDNLCEDELRGVFAGLDYKGPIDIRLAAEYFIDEKYTERLEQAPLTMNCRHILSEFSINGYSLSGFDMLFEASLAGFEIILAHPERYIFVQSNRDKVFNLIRQHKLQLNLLSLGGFYGSSAKKCAERLLNEDRYTFVGTDTHSVAHLDFMKKTKVSNKVADQVKKIKENNVILF